MYRSTHIDTDRDMNSWGDFPFDKDAPLLIHNTELTSYLRKNIEEFGLPSFITSYNAKPVLIRNTSTMYSSSSIEGKEGSCSYLEIDLNVHKFGSVPKKALATMIDKFSSMRVSSGFCIESRVDDEMPETMLGVSTTYKPDHSKAMQWEEVCK